MESERLVIDHFGPDDYDLLCALAGDPAVAGSGGWPVYDGKPDTGNLLMAALTAPIAFAIRLKGRDNTDVLIGGVKISLRGISSLDIGDNEGEISFWIGKPYWGRNYGLEAVMETLRYAFEELGLKRVWAAYFDGNKASEKLLAKAGFSYIYTMEDLWWFPSGDIRTEHIMLLE